MQTLRRILVAVKDPTRSSLPAVDKAAQLAKAYGARIELFHAIATRFYVDSVWNDGGFASVEHQWQADSLKQLEGIAARVREQGIIVSCSAECDYPVHESIVRRANRMKADLIVAECHEGRRIAPWLLHLTDWELLRVSPVPVLLVKTPGLYSNPVILAAVDPTHRFAKPSGLDTRILKTASSLRGALHGTLHAVHCYTFHTPALWAAETLNAELMSAEHEKAEARAWADFDWTLRDSDIPRANRHLIARPPTEAIQDVAQQTQAAIVVMGAVSRSGLKRVFIGNTAEQVLGQLPCDLLVVKPARFANRVPHTRRRPHVLGPIPPGY